MASRHGLVTTILSASLGLTACAVGPHYTPPAAPVATSFHNAPSPDASAPLLASWWTGFNDAELSSLVTRALKQNLDLAQAEARVTQARAQAKAAGAALLPAAQATGQGEYQYQSLANPTARLESAFPGFQRYQKLYDLDAGASWEPDLFGGLRRGAQAARAQYQAGEAARAGAQISVVAETADAYVQLRALQARLAVAQDAANTQAELADLTSLLFDHGVVARAQLDQARAGAAQAAAAIPALKSGVEAETLALEVLVGVEPGALHAELAGPAPIPTPPGVDTAGGPASLVRRRPDIIAAERTLAAADARIGAAIADYYPKISLSGSVGYEASDITQLVTPASFQPQGVVGVRWRLFDFGRVDAEVAGARGARAEALAAYRQAVLQATADVEAALSALAQNQAQARSLGDAEASLAQSLDATTAATATGHAARTDLLTARSQLLAARDQHLQAQAAATRSAIATFRALGGGWSN